MPVSGLKIYSSKGILYCYDRISGTRIKAAVGTTEFFDEIKAAREPAQSANFGPGTLGDVIAQYTADDSPAWTELSPDTQKSYNRVFEVIEGIRTARMSQMTRGGILKLRDQTIKPQHGRWMANYTVTVIGILFSFAVDYEVADIKVNPLAKRVRRLRKPKGESNANRPWRPHECEVVLAEAPPRLLVPLALVMFAGVRKRDMLTATLSALKDGEVWVRTSKRGKAVMIPQHPRLVEALKRRPARPDKGKIAANWPDAVQIAITSRGAPWTESGFNSSWEKFKTILEKAGKVDHGLTIHGLRHTLGTRLREAGASDRDITDILGQSSAAMAKHYSDDAELPDDIHALVLEIDPTKPRKRRVANLP